MRLMTLALAVGLLWPTSTFAQDNGVRRGYVDGNKLYQMCNSSDLFICKGYVTGVSDALNAVRPDLFCAPLSVTIDQEVAVVVKYLRDHPETWHYSGASDVDVALSHAFPCK